MPLPSEPTVPSDFFSRHLSEQTHALAASTPRVESAFAGAPRQLTDELADAADALAGELGDLALDLYEHPEPAFEEHRSAAALASLLAGHGVEATVGVHGLETALRAEFVAGDARRTVAISAEYDALPGIGHGCGHNVIAACGVGAFLALHALHRRRPDAFAGRVVLLGTPAEEGHSGKEYLAREGAFDGVDAAMMVHSYGYDLADQVWLGRRVLTVTFHGRPAHASAEPFMGRNALDAANLMYTGIGLLRQQMLPVDRVHAIITEGGSRASVIPETARLDLYARSKYPQTLRDLSARLDDIAHGAALMAGVGVTVEWDRHPATLPVRTNQALTARWATAQARRGRTALPLGVVPETIAASTDFGNVSYRVPGIHPLIKIAPEGCALHTREFADAAATPAARRAAVDGAFGLAATALDFLCDDDLAAAVAREFADEGGPVDVEHYFD